MRLPQIAIVVMLAAAAVQLAYFYPHLPAVIASHFNAAGIANSWQPKGAFVGAMCFVYALLAGMYLLLPQLMMSMPPSLINLPNKAYWLAPERRLLTAHMVGDEIAWLGVAVFGFIIFVTQLAINANLPGANGQLGQAMWWFVAIFLVISIAWTVRFYRMFSRTSG
jgi:uncharacterized membrane protein